MYLLVRLVMCASRGGSALARAHNSFHGKSISFHANTSSTSTLDTKPDGQLLGQESENTVL